MSSIQDKKKEQEETEIVIGLGFAITLCQAIVLVPFGYLPWWTFFLPWALIEASTINIVSIAFLGKNIFSSIPVAFLIYYSQDLEPGASQSDAAIPATIAFIVHFVVMEFLMDCFKKKS